MYDHIAEKLRTGETIVIDGGTGTDLEKRGAEMVGAAWCAYATRTSPDILREVHDDYIAAGAEVIAANTYATTLPMIEAAGDGEAVWEELTVQSMEIAHAAAGAADGPVAVAGSFSVMRPMTPGGDLPSASYVFDEAREREIVGKQAALLKELGADLLIMEMLRGNDLSVWAVEAAQATGLPVWNGMSTVRDDAGTVVSFHDKKTPFAEFAPRLMAAGGEVAGVMHTIMNDMDPSLEVLREHWDGPLMAYPESGHFTMPYWQFGDMTPGEFAAACRDWVQGGIQIVGGCCGVSVEHIAALKGALPSHAGGSR
ncbi:MAG: homocysteine S-methyltransferase family protein [Pseudomonadota bacterium]